MPLSVCVTATVTARALSVRLSLARAARPAGGACGPLCAVGVWRAACVWVHVCVWRRNRNYKGSSPLVPIRSAYTLIRCRQGGGEGGHRHGAHIAAGELHSSSSGHAIKRFNSFSRACDGLLSVCLELLGPVWSRPSKGATWPPLTRYVARVALCQGGGWIALPHPRLMSKSRSRWPATFCARGRQPPVEKFGRLEHLAQKGQHKSDVWQRCIGGLSRRVHGSGQSKRRSPGSSAGSLQHTPGPHLLPGEGVIQRTLRQN